MTVLDVHAHHVDPDALHEMAAASDPTAPALVVADDTCLLRYPDGAALGPFPLTLVDLDRRQVEMDRLGVDVQVLSVPPALYGYELPAEVGAAYAAAQNDGLLRGAGSVPGRFGVFATLPLQDLDAARAEIERIAARPFLLGVEMGTHVLDRNLGDAAFAPLWEALAGHDLVVLVHPDQRFVAGAARLRQHYLNNFVGNPMETTIAIASLIFSGTVSRAHVPRFCFVHGGGFAPYQLGRWDHGWGLRAEARTELTEPPSEVFRRLFFDSLTHDDVARTFLVGRAGLGQILLGSDYPYDMADADPVGSLRHLPEDLRDLIAHENWRGFLAPQRVASIQLEPAAGGD